MKTLYDKNAKYTHEANVFEMKIENAIRDIFNEYVEHGYSPRELSHLAMGAVFQLELIAMLPGQLPDKVNATRANAGQQSATEEELATLLGRRDPEKPGT
jgi:hypothetical protein